MSAAATTFTPWSARANSIRCWRRRNERKPESGQFPDREDLREGPLARDSQRPAGLHAAGAAAARGPDRLERKPVRRRLLRGNGQRHRDRQGRPDDPVPLSARDDLRSHHPRRLPARPARPGVLRSALRAAHAAVAAAKPGRAEDRSRPVTRVAVLGAGAWGTSIASVLAARLEVTLWARDPTQAESIARTRRNERYLRGIEIPAAVKITSNLADVERAELFLAATPVAGLRELLQKIKK